MNNQECDKTMSKSFSRLIHASPVTLCLLGLMLVLVPALAYWQYRWIAEVSEREKEQMQKNITESTQRLARDLDTEYSRLYMMFRIAPKSARTSESDSATPMLAVRHQLRAVYSAWRVKTAHPNLLSSVYAVTKQRDELELSWFDTTSLTLAHTDWTPELAEIKREMTRRLAADSASSDGFNFQSMDKIFVPVFVQSSVLSSGLNQAKHGYVVLILNPDYLRSTLIQELVQSHIRTDDYDVAVVNTPRHVFYRSSLAVPAELPDVSMPLGKFRFADIIADMMDTLHAPSQSPLGVMKKIIAVSDSVGITNAITLKTTTPHQTSLRTMSHLADTSFHVLTSGVKTSISKSTDSLLNKSVIITLFGNASSAQWQIHVWHRSGSLDKAVSKARLRNLVISFGVLTLLAASLVMMAVTTERAKKLAAQQMEFVAGVSHELRTPLAVIRSAAENLADGIVRDEQQVRHYGDLIRREGRRLSSMVEQVMTFAGIESQNRQSQNKQSTPVYQIQPLDLTALIRDALERYAPELEAHAFHVELQLAANLPAINGDKTAVDSAIQNLLENAIKYSAETKRLTVRTADDGNMIQLSVSDSGIGISPEDLKHIVEPFYRSQVVRDAQIKGNGLGLSLVHRIMEAHAGNLSVQSKLGIGSTFTLRFPKHDETKNTAG
jgi:signal transduction histidine kinase